jgi:hypothetical protein
MHPFIPSSLIPSRAFYMRAAFSVMAGMFKVEPTIEWLPRLSPQLVGSASSDLYLNGWVARPLNGLPHEPFPDRHRTVRARHINRPQNICHRVDANASFDDGRFWTSDLAGKVADMLATCRPDSQKSALLADSAKSCRHKFIPNTFFCVGVCRLSPNFL